MANIKILLDSRRAKSDGTFNVILRITHQKRVYTLNTGVSVLEQHWNFQNLQVDRTHPNSKLFNLKLTKEYFRTQEALLKLGDDFSMEALREILNGKLTSNKNISFKMFSEKLISQMFENNKTGNALVYKTAVNRFLNFAGDNIKFNQINYDLLEKFNSNLLSNGLKQNSISNYFRTIRSIYNKAIKQKIIDRSQYPFYDITIKSETTLKRAVLKEDIVKLRNLNLEEYSSSWMALNYFLLSYYLIGISFTDLAYLKKDNIEGGRIVYKRRKTHKYYSIKIFPEAQIILDKMFKISESDYLLPILSKDIPEDGIKAKRLIQQRIKVTNKHLKRLAKQIDLLANITTYVARHTFATTAKKMGYSNELIAEALGHEYGNKVTNTYLDCFDKEIIDEMHRNVII